MTIERQIEILAKSALFQNLPMNALAEIAVHGTEHKLQQGQILFNTNELADGMYVVLSGSVRAFRENMDGREQTIHVERVGGTLAEVSVFDGGPYPSTTMAEEDSELLFLAKEDVRRFMHKYPEIALTALAIMAKKLRTVASLAEQLALKDVSQRLAMLLLEEAQRKIRCYEMASPFRCHCRTCNWHRGSARCARLSRAACRNWCSRKSLQSAAIASSFLI